MQIGILVTGDVNDALVDTYGEYTPMFEALLSAADDTLTFRSFEVLRGTFPDAPDSCDGWIVTGSKFGVYEDHPWIDPLKSFLRECLTSKVPVVGVCFGHQILAEAMGGKVVKSDKGWGAGVHSYKMTDAAKWMSGTGHHFAALAMHQDQVIEKPQLATVLAQSEFCEYAALAYGDIDAPVAISVQPHPEFTPDFVGDLIRVRQGDGIPDEVAEPALTTLNHSINNSDWARWMVTFLREAAARRAI